MLFAMSSLSMILLGVYMNASANAGYALAEGEAEYDYR